MKGSLNKYEITLYIVVLHLVIAKYTVTRYNEFARKYIITRRGNTYTMVYKIIYYDISITPIINRRQDHD